MMFLICQSIRMRELKHIESFMTVLFIYIANGGRHVRIKK